MANTSSPILATIRNTGAIFYSVVFPHQLIVSPYGLATAQS